MIDVDVTRTLRFVHRRRDRPGDWPLLHLAGDASHTAACGRQLNAPIYIDLTAAEYARLMRRSYVGGYNRCLRCPTPPIIETWEEV